MEINMDRMIDGYCKNCGCPMRNGRHQDSLRGCHGEFCDCDNPEYGG